MMKLSVIKTMVFSVVTVLIMACAGGTGYWQVPARHYQDPEENLRLCLDCHETADGEFPYSRFVHTVYFSENHGQVARQHQQVCAMCHSPSYCDECHGMGIELKPSLKNQTQTGKRMPHRGDYLSRHRIDGRMNPVSCIRCHGNPKTARTCIPCHG